MSFAALAAVAVMVSAPMAAAQPREEPAPKVSVSLIAVRATHQGHEERQFDRSIASIHETVEDLKQFDDFRQLRAVTTTAAYGEETKIPIDARYTLILKPVQRASHNRIRCNIRVDMRLEKEEDKSSSDDDDEPKFREVLRCTLLAVSDKPFKVGGLRLDEGLLVLILTLTDPQTNTDA